MDKKELRNLIDRISLTGPGGVDKIKKVLKELLQSGGGEGDVTEEELQEALAEKQDTLVSGESIKTINNESLLGTGNISIPKGDKGDKGDQGNSGYQGEEGELEVVNNLTDGGATSALSAEMGKTLKGEVSQLEAEVTDIADFAYNTAINGIRYYDNQQWLDGTTKTTASRAGSTGRAAFYPIPCKKGQVFHISVGYFGWQQTQVVSAAVVDENYLILERFHPSGPANSLDFQFTITADNAKYLLINSYNTSYNSGVDKNWYYTDPNERSIARGAIARTARLCTEHPDLAKAWYDKLPKVTMD